MIRQNIIVDNYKYLVDLYKYAQDIPGHQEEYVMLRNFNLRSNIQYDSDLYFVEKSLLKKYLNEDGDLIFPVTKDSFIDFSIKNTAYNEDYDSVNFYIKDNKQGDSIYDLYNVIEENGKKTLTPTKIFCDKVRIYHPHVKTSINAIVYCDLFINNLHIHLFCKELSSIETHSENEYSEDHNFYSEYADFYIPNIESIISKDIYYKENTNMIDVENYKQYKDLVFTPDRQEEYTNEGELFASLYLLTIPFKFIETKDETGVSIVKKIFLPELNNTIENNFTRFPINIGLFPFDNIDSEGTYQYGEVNGNSDQFAVDCRITMASKLGFSDGTISMINEFQYPNKKNFVTFKEAYEYYYNVDLNDYVGIADIDDEDYNEEEPTEQKQCSFSLDIYSDLNYKHNVYHVSRDLENPGEDLDDIAWNINGLFENWDQYPELFVIRCKFADKYIGKTVYSNPVIITKEWFKYFINDSNKSRIILENQQNKIDKISEMDLSKFNFIDKVKCTIKREAETTQSISNGSSINKILYKPIFYRTYDLQNIQLVSGLTQNIGINLADYMTKVDTFKLTIDGHQYIESARNDIYVIFSIDTSLLNSETGTYHIINQDDEYISSGSWSIKI
jgi:hypothetical protein